MGRKKVRTLLKQYSLVTTYAGGDDVEKSEAYTNGSPRGRYLGGPAGPESMARRKRSVRKLEDPYVSC